MYENIINGHRYLAMLVLPLLLVLLVIGLLSYLSNKKSKAIKTLSAIITGFVHLQFLMGLIVFFYGLFSKTIVFSGALMQNSELRRKYVEHPVGVLVAIILLTIANMQVKKRQKYSLFSLILVAIAVVLIGYLIPSIFWARFNF